jgi:tetratricopeptide (TPR) repeat protein
MATVGVSQPRTILQQATEGLKTGTAERWIPPVARLLQATPADPIAWQVHGLLLRDTDRRELAIPSLRRAAQLDPRNVKIAHALARTLREAGLPCLDAYGAALQLSPGNPDIMLDIAGALIAEGRAADARRGLQQVLGRSPEWVHGQSLLSQTRWLDGERDGFTSNFDMVLRSHPTNLELRREQIMCLGHAKHYGEVLRVVADGRAAMGEHLLFDASEAIAYAEMGELERADVLFEQLTPIADAALAVRRVRHLLRSQRLEAAAALLENWLSRDSAAMFWPYAASTWRLLGDPRYQWLEGDERFVGVYDLADRLPDLTVLANKLRSLHTTRSQPLMQSVRGGTQTDGNLFSLIDPVIVQLREAVRAAVAEHAAALPAPHADHPLLRTRRSPIRFAGAWSVRLAAGGRHASHVHPMGWFSSALYILLPPDLGREQAGWLALGEPPPELGLGLPPARLIEPKPGRLALFPSTMWHATKAFAEGERMTVAFDVAVPS